MVDIFLVQDSDVENLRLVTFYWLFKKKHILLACEGRFNSGEVRSTTTSLDHVSEFYISTKRSERYIYNECGL